MIKMYNEAMKTALAGITSFGDLDGIDDDDDPNFTDDMMEKMTVKSLYILV